MKYVNENFRINNGGERVIFFNLSKRKWLGVDGMLTERLFIYGCQFYSLHDCLFDGLWFFTQQLGQVAFLPTATRPIYGAVLAYAQE